MFQCYKANTSASECCLVVHIFGQRKSVGLQEDLVVYAPHVCLVSESKYVHVQVESCIDVLNTIFRLC